MLKANNLKTLCDEIQAQIPTIGKNLVLVSDDDVANHTRELNVSDDNLILIGVLPGFTLKGIDEDSMRYNNRVLFFIVKKQDIKAGEAAFLELFDDTGEVVKKFVEYAMAQYRRFPKCLWQHLDLKTLTVEPIRDYHNLSGYMIDVNLIN